MGQLRFKYSLEGSCPKKLDLPGYCNDSWSSGYRKNNDCRRVHYLDMRVAEVESDGMRTE